MNLHEMNPPVEVSILSGLRAVDPSGLRAAELHDCDDPRRSAAGKLLYPLYTGDAKLQGGRIARNQPCPCGSGKKFKRCCAAKGFLVSKLKDDVVAASIPDTSPKS